MIYSIILLLLLSPLLLAADCVRGLRKVDLNFHPNLIFVTNHPQRSTAVRLHVYLVFVKSIEQELKIQ